jgi:hypothetical protein
MHSKVLTEIQQHLLYANIDTLWIDVPFNMGTFDKFLSVPLYQNIDDLSIMCESQRTTFRESVIQKLSKQKLNIITLFFVLI